MAKSRSKAKRASKDGPSEKSQIAKVSAAKATDDRKENAANAVMEPARRTADPFAVPLLDDEFGDFDEVQNAIRAKLCQGAKTRTADDDAESEVDESFDARPKPFASPGQRTPAAAKKLASPSSAAKRKLQMQEEKQVRQFMEEKKRFFDEVDDFELSEVSDDDDEAAVVTDAGAEQRQMPQDTAKAVEMTPSSQKQRALREIFSPSDDKAASESSEQPQQKRRRSSRKAF